MELHDRDQSFELDLLKKAGGFPQPDPERDTRVKAAIRKALAAARPARKGTWGLRKSLAVAAAWLIVGGLGVWLVSPTMTVSLRSTVTGGTGPTPEAPRETILGADGGHSDRLTDELKEQLEQVLGSYSRERYSRAVRVKEPVVLVSAGDVSGYIALQEEGRTSLTAPREYTGLRLSAAGADGPRAVASRSGAGTPVTTWKPSTLPSNASRLLVGDKEELPLKAFQAKLRVDGFRARVLLDLYYLNDRDRQLEGNFQLRLPGDASPYYLAFGETAWRASELASAGRQVFASLAARDDSLEPEAILKVREGTWSAVREARMAPREKAALAYRETVRRVVDPALLEWSGAGVFSARVFPLAAGKLHRITLGYDLDLTRAGADLEHRLELPSGVPERTVDLEVADIPGAAIETTPKAEAARSEGRARFRFENPGEGAITLRLKDPGPLLLRGTDARTGPFFAAAFTPELPAEQVSGSAREAIFLLDTSLSANPGQFAVWLKLLRAILDQNRGSLERFAVLCFNIESFWWQEKLADNTPANVEALSKFAEGLALEGATDLGSALAEAASPRWLPRETRPAPRDLFLLSDGAATWGERDPRALAGLVRSPEGGPLFAYSTGLAGVDTTLLAHLARESGGAVFAVAGEAEVAKAATAHRLRPWLLAGVEVQGGSDLLLAGRPVSIYPGQDLLLVGRGVPAAPAEVVLKLRRGIEERTARARLGAAIDSELAPRAYGQVAVGQLEDFEASTEEFSKAYATHFRVTGRTCSLLLLEREEDYARYRINPEEDAFVVASRPASEVVARVLSELGETLADPKAAFLAWLRRLEKLPGVELGVSPALRLALEALPRQAFEVAPPALRARLRTGSAVPGGLQEKLAARDLDYDAFAAEAERRLKELGAPDALKALSSLVEESPGDLVLARDVGFSALEWGLGGHAYGLFRRTAEARPFEPHAYHAAALALEELGRLDLALAFFEVGLAGRWDGRFGDFRRVLAHDYLRFLRRMARGGEKPGLLDFARARLESVQREFGAGKSDLCVLISWNTDGTDVDLHVTEPSGEVCFYGHKTTKLGGRYLHDVTQGYGPEMYTLRDAVPGEYKVQVKYFAGDRNRLSARAKVHAAVYRNLGTPEESVERKTVVLSTGQEMHDIATVKVAR